MQVLKFLFVCAVASLAGWGMADIVPHWLMMIPSLGMGWLLGAATSRWVNE